VNNKVEELRLGLGLDRVCERFLPNESYIKFRSIF